MGNFRSQSAGAIVAFLLISQMVAAQNRPSPVTNSHVKIGIIGGGVAGLTAAFELTKLGFKDLTIFEANEEVGGKVYTYNHPDTHKPYEVGAIVQSDSFKNIYEIAKYTGFAKDPKNWLKAYPQRAIVVDSAGRDISTFLAFHQGAPNNNTQYNFYSDFLAAKHLVGVLAPWGLLNHTGIYEPGFDTLLANAKVSPQKAQTLRRYFETTDNFLANVPNWSGHGNMTSLQGRYSLFFNMTGYGFTSEVPALYHLKFLKMVTKVATDQIVSVGMASGMTNAKLGYQNFFVYLKNWLVSRGVKIQLKHRVLDINRSNTNYWETAGPKNTIFYSNNGGPTENSSFDFVLVATSPKAAKGFLKDANQDEREMLERVQYYNFITTIFESHDPKMSTWKKSTVFVSDHALNSTPTQNNANVIGIYNNDGSNVFTAYQFARVGVSNELLNDQLRKDLQKMGGKLDRILITQQWRDYFPHYSSDALKSYNGQFLKKIVDLQGKRNTLFLMAQYEFESTEHMAGFSKAMINRYFAGKR